MTISDYPSHLSLPQANPGVTTVLEYLIIKFPYIDALIWQQRMARGKVHYHDGSLVTPHSLFQAQQRIYYYREVECWRMRLRQSTDPPCAQCCPGHSLFM